MAKRVSIEASDFLSGLDTLVDELNYTVAEMEDNSILGLKRGASRIMAEAKDRVPLYMGGPTKSHPTAGGALRASGTVKDPVQTDEHTIELEFGFYEEYAATQHEHTEYEHEQGEAKYLETAIINNKDELLRLIAEGILR